jgi:hypothetical protein
MAMMNSGLARDCDITHIWRISAFGGGRLVFAGYGRFRRPLARRRPVRNGAVARTLLRQFGAENPKELGMATQIVMDHTGDTRHYFDADDTKALSKAEERFKALTSLGFTAAVRTAAGEVTMTRSFDPTAEETLFFPRLVGG